MNEKKETSKEFIKAKQFLQEVGKNLRIILDLSDRVKVKKDFNVAIEEINQALKLSKETRAKFEQGNFPRIIPQKIVKRYKEYLDFIIEMMEINLTLATAARDEIQLCFFFNK